MAILGGALALGCVLLLLALRMPLGLAMALVGACGLWIVDGERSLIFVLSNAPVDSLSNYTLSVVPLFILMGALAARGGLASGLYKSANALVGHYRGGLATSTILASGAFGAVCGSSLATVATIGRIALPEMQRFGYSKALAAGTVASGGTLGILIPPSVAMVIYAILTETSVGQLFLAGLIPGIIAIVLYATTVAIWTRLNPELAGPPQKPLPFVQRVLDQRHMLGMFTLFTVVVGGIVAGIFSPTEGAAIGVGMALVIGLVGGTLNASAILESLRETASFSVSLLFILLGIVIFEFFLNALSFPQELASFIRSFDAEPWQVVMIVLLVLILLGCFLESLTVILLTVPVLHPLIVEMDLNLIWWGIVMVVTIELGLVTPPVGLNVYVMARMVPDLDLWTAFRGVAPFVVTDLLRLALIVTIPAISLWLPDLVYGGLL